MSKIRDGVFDLIGETPLVRLARLSAQSGAAERAEILAKLEFRNPGGSIKDRPAREIILSAEERGELGPGATIIESSSGNTGVSLAMLCAARGYRCVVVMPEDMSLERRYLLRGFGAEVVLTKKERGMTGAVEVARELAAKTPNAFMARQFENPDNPRAHEKTTAKEILDATEGRLDVLVAGVGTGGTITGCARALRVAIPSLRVVAVEPSRAAAFRGQPFQPHAIQGIGAGFIPKIVDRELLSEVIAVDDEQALKTAVALAREEGLLCGPSSGANVFVALREAERAGAGKRVLTFLCDTGERYLL